MSVGVNYYDNGSGSQIRLYTGGVSVIDISGDVITFRNAGSDSAGTTISFVERMRITSGGDTELVKTGIAGITNSTSNTLRFRNTQTNAQSVILGTIFTTSLGSWGGDMIFTTHPSNGSPDDSTTERMRITSGGDVGIGNWSTNVPQDRLHVNGAIQVGFVNSLNSALRIFWNGASSYGAIQTSSSSALALNPSGNNVLIGTTSDTGQKLQVSAGDTGESTAHLLLSNAGIYSGFHFLDGTAYYIGQNSNFRSLRIYSGGSTGTGVNLAAGATSWGTYSDERLKENIEDIDSVLPRLSNLRTVKYHFKNIDTEDSKKRLGLIAQDLIGNFDEVLSQSRYSDQDETEYYDVRYTELIPVLVKAIQELKSENDTLKSILQRNNIS
jgi:hypothetical protein